MPTSRASRNRCEVRHPEHRAPVLRVALLEEVDRAGVVLVHVLQVRGRLDDRAVDRRLERRVERERLREAPVLGPVRVPAGHQSDEIVLHGLRAVLRRERRRRLAGPRQADDHDDLLAGGGRDHLEAGVQRQPALAVDDVVPHPQAALLRLTEVVGVEDTRDAVLEIDRDQPVVRVARGREVRRVDHLHLGLGAVGALEVELLLHAGDVRVGLLDREARGRAQLGVVADVAVDHDHIADRARYASCVRRDLARTPRGSSSCRVDGPPTTWVLAGAPRGDRASAR